MSFLVNDQGGDNLNKKILGITLIAVFLAMLVAPVMAKPTKGNKVAVTLNIVRTGFPTQIEVPTGPITHGYWVQIYKATITFADDSTLEGELVAYRKVVVVPQKVGFKMIFTDYNVFTFRDGGFEGNAKVVIDEFVWNVPPPGATWKSTLAYGLFHGAGAFEGQTLNVGHTWGGPSGTPAPWTGYWLKYTG